MNCTTCGCQVYEANSPKLRPEVMTIHRARAEARVRVKIRVWVKS